jgi:hypothetical protein
MRAESKALRQHAKKSIKGQAFDIEEELHFDLLNDEEPH